MRELGGLTLLLNLLTLYLLIKLMTKLTYNSPLEFQFVFHVYLLFLSALNTIQSVQVIRKKPAFINLAFWSNLFFIGGMADVIIRLYEGSEFLVASFKPNIPADKYGLCPYSMAAE